MPTFSVIVPIYNVEKYIYQCIDSILKQTYQDFELILVDDGSPDNCPIICDNYAADNHRVKVLHKRNGGLVSARKAGANIATGEYIVCVDGDDWIDTEYLSRFAEIANRYTPDVIACGCVRYSEDVMRNNTLPYRKGYYARGEIISEIFPMLIQNENAQYFAPSVWAKAYRAQLYIPLQNRVDDKIKIGEDGACVIPIVYNAQSLYVMAECGYFYRQNPTSMTKEHKAFDLQGPKMIYQHLLTNINVKEYDFRSQLCMKTTHELFLAVVSQFNRNDKYNVIKSDIKQCLNDPVYRCVISETTFKGIKGRIATWVMKYRFYHVMKLINYVRRRG